MTPRLCSDPSLRDRSRSLGVLLVAFLLPGCLEMGLPGSSSSSSSDVPADEEPVAEDGSCNGWKVSYCKAVGKCSSFDKRDECEDSVGYVICGASAPYAECQAKIDKALAKDSCEALPADCGPDEIADRNEPYKVCQQMRQAICEWSLYCGASLSIDGCLAGLELNAPCSGYTAAIYPDVEKCLDRYAILSCEASAPPECEGILRK